VRRKKRTGWLAAGGLRLIEMPLPLRERRGGVQLALQEGKRKSHDFIASKTDEAISSMGKAIPDPTYSGFHLQ